MVATLETPKVTTPGSAGLQELFILPLREKALFPKAVLPLTLGRAGHIELVKTEQLGDLKIHFARTMEELAQMVLLPAGEPDVQTKSA